jgi:hypothetical protein
MMRSSSLRLRIALCSGLVVILAGAGYMVVRDQRWQSTASLALTPTAVSPADRAALFDSFDRSGTMGTYVELISSADTLHKAGSPPVSVEARAVPSTRVIDVTATGGQDQVRPALTRLIGVSAGIGTELGDVWQLNLVDGPSAPTESGPSNSVLLVATLLLAVLATVASFVLIGELGFPRSASESVSRDSAEPSEPWDSAERSRYRNRDSELIVAGSRRGDGAARR